MKLNEVEYKSLSTQRGALMGLAMLFIVLFHVWVPRQHWGFGLHRMGNIGVDMFFFLSGIGLWYSWTKNPSWRQFQWKRYVRIYPTWLVVAAVFYTMDFFGGQRYSTSLTDLFGDVLINWDFWLHDEGTFWYIPATMMLYLFAPAYMEAVRRNPMCRWIPVLMIVWCCAVQWVIPIHKAVGHIEIFWSRIPIFLIGLNFGDLVKRKETMPQSTIILLLSSLILPLALCLYLEQVLHGKFPLFVERMIYIPMTVSVCMLAARWLEKSPAWLTRALVFIGGLSLEIYLIHYQFVMIKVAKWQLGYWLTALLTLLITLPIAWLLQKLISKLTSKLIKS